MNTKMAAPTRVLVRSIFPRFNITLSHKTPISQSFFALNRVNSPRLYLTSSKIFNQSAPTAEKSQNEGTSEPKTEDISSREKELLAENEKLLETIQTLDDKYKRALAENENVRIRMRREISDAKQYGIQNFVKDLIEVADVLGRATESVPKDALQTNSHLKSLFEGLQMTEAQLQSVFKRYGVTQICPIGEKFDPNHHEALFEQDDPSKEPGTVGTVTKVGYKLHERVVRPAMVGVVKAVK